jgi:hypothetical protein
VYVNVEEKGSFIFKSIHLFYKKKLKFPSRILSEWRGDSIGIFQALERILQRILVIYSLKRTSDMYRILEFPA